MSGPQGPPPPYNQAADTKGDLNNPPYAPPPGAPQQPYPPAPQGAYPPPQPGAYPPPQQGAYPPAQPQYPPAGGSAYPAPPAGAYPAQGNYPAAPGPYASPQYPQYGQQMQQTTIVTQPQPVMTTVVMQSFRDAPVQTSCPHCQASIVTATRYEVGGFAWLICAILCIVGCDLGCCFIPFCVESCKDVIHSCPNCHQTISRFNRL